MQTLQFRNRIFGYSVKLGKVELFIDAHCEKPLQMVVNDQLIKCSPDLIKQIKQDLRRPDKVKIDLFTAFYLNSVLYY